MGGWCDACRRVATGKGIKVSARPYNTDPKIKERREAELLDWRRKFEADRRARGIPEEGILFKGETPSEPQQPKMATVAYGGPGKCKYGHDYDTVDRTGRRRCTACMKRNGGSGGRPRKAPDPEDGTAPYGRCKKGHPYFKDSYGARRCRICRAAQKVRYRARVAAGQEYHDEEA
jgi:hypothetical protein